ncbi:MAG: putative repeat protein (TIGR01451 family) [Crocinitomix sp.]|jgi:uncharacterized repeat protein (TIGR01451 family)
MKTLTLFLLSITAAFSLRAQLFNEHPIDQGIRMPVANVASDVDGDGDLDIVIASQDDNKIGWYENIGDNEFLREKPITLQANGITSIFLTDLNGDASQDVLAANSSDNSVVWFENDGAGNFETPILITDLVLNVQAVWAADLDDDGDMDVLTASKDDDKIAWFENLGGGVFGSESILSTSSEGAKAVSTGDFNGDGDLDIMATSVDDGKIVWFENLGGATFSSENIITDLADGVSSAMIVDVDEDGDLDVVNSSMTLNEVAWYENTGGGVFAAKEVIATNAIGIRAVALGDVNVDGEIDIIYGTDYAIHWSEHSGGGTYLSAVELFNVTAIAHETQCMTIADVNADGTDDIILGINDYWGLESYYYSFRDATLIYSNEGGVFSDHKVAPTSFRIEDMSVADLNEDGILDIVTASWRGDDAIIYYPGLGDDEYAEPILLSNEEEHGTNVFTGDLDGDGDLDVIYADGFYPTVYIAWCENLGLGVFAEREIISDDTYTQALELHDLDGDGDLDMVYINSSGTETLWIENLGGGTFSSPVELIIESTVRSMTFYDMDVDGDMDILTAYYAGNIAWIENVGDGVFGDEHLITDVEPDAYGPIQLIMRDMDDDGDHDLITNSRFLKTIRYYENIDGTYEEGLTIINSVDTVNQIGVEDFDLDGDFDIVTLDVYGGVKTFENTGDMEFAAPFLEYDYPFSSSENYLEIIDADADGDLDFFNCSKEFTNLSYFENLSNTEQQAAGKVYFDDNMNGVMDGAEYGLSTIQVLTSPFAGFSFTDGVGDYRIDLTDVEDGTYTFFPTGIPYWEITSDPEAHEVILDDLFVLEDDLNFGIHPGEIVRELAPELTSTHVRCYDENVYWITFQNTGTTIAEGQIHLELHESVTFVSAELTPDLIDGDNIYWSYADLGYFETFAIPVIVDMPGYEYVDVPLESFLTVTIDTLGDELFIATTSLLHEFGCAWDPNDKTAIPAGEGDLGYISHETEWIEYKIRFQNTGTDTATNVVIEDQLDENLNWLTLTPLANSHDMEVSVNTDGLISFEFENIMLPDSNVNVLASQGFVKYKIALNLGLPVGTSIYNSADIYFDFNPAVITNTKVHTLVDNLSLEDQVGSTDQISVYPNPASEFVTVYFGSEDAGDYEIKIYNILGKLVYLDENLDAISTQINTTQLNKGMYILVVTSIDDGSQLYNTKLIIK